MANANETSQASRPPTPDELRQLADLLVVLGHDSQDAIPIAQSAYVAVYDRYITGCPGYCGKLMSVVWDGGPSFFDVFTWKDGKLVREGREYDERECYRCGEKSGTLCWNCWRNEPHRQRRTSSAHTPGPWKLESRIFDESASEDHHGYRVIYGGGRDIAYSLITSESPHSPSQEDQDVCEANARLIAAAPELLEACEQILALFHEEIEKDEPISGADFLDDFLTTRVVLVEAVAKAKGKAA